jgi:photosystem II stability/assembly factor-like uncharacterized protein
VDRRHNRFVRALRLLVLIAAVALLPAGSAGSARYVARLAPNSISFWDAQHGLVGTGPTWCSACGVGTIQTTDDGGRTWRIRFRPRDRITDVATSGSQHGWALVQRCTLTGGCSTRTILHSGDRGRTWRSISKARLMDLSFADEANGLATPLRVTRDGGRSWTPLREPCARRSASDRLIGVSLPSQYRGWALCVGVGGVGQQPKAVYETVDRGHTWVLRAWSSITSTGRGGLGAGGYPLGIAFRPSGLGLLWESRGALFVTKDGARTWRNAGITRYDVDFGQSAALPSERVWFVLLQTGGRFRLVATRDAGAHWRTVHRWG